MYISAIEYDRKIIKKNMYVPLQYRFQRWTYNFYVFKNRIKSYKNNKKIKDSASSLFFADFLVNNLPTELQFLLVSSRYATI